MQPDKQDDAGNTAAWALWRLSAAAAVAAVLCAVLMKLDYAAAVARVGFWSALLLASIFLVAAVIAGAVERRLTRGTPP